MPKSFSASKSKEEDDLEERKKNRPAETLNWQNLGQVGRPHGLNGYFFINQDQDSNLLAHSHQSLIMGKDPTCGMPVTVLKTHMVSGRRVLKVQGIDDREAVIALRDTDFWVEKASSDFEGLEGTEVTDLNGEIIGKVIAIANYGASDIVSIENQSKQLIDLPLIDSYFKIGPQLQLVIPLADISELWQ